MEEALKRLNSVTSFALSVLVVLTAITALSSLFVEWKPDVDVKTNSIELKRFPNFGTNYELNDLGIITFDVKYNFTDIFNWNVKVLFVYLSVEYETEESEFNQLVLWDRIILRGDNAFLAMKEAASKYYFWDDGQGLRNNQNVSLYLSWNVIPVAGQLADCSGPTRHHFKFPNTYKVD